MLDGAKRAYGEEGAMLKFVRGVLKEFLEEVRRPAGVPRIVVEGPEEAEEEKGLFAMDCKMHERGTR